MVSLIACHYQILQNLMNSVEMLNSAARLKILQPAENSGPYLFLPPKHQPILRVHVNFARQVFAQ